MKCTRATFSLAASITGAGWTSTGIKYARKVINNAGNKSVLKYIVRSSDNIIQFGSRSQLRNVLKTTTGKQAHHIIPWEFGENAVVQAASKVKNATDFHMNDLPNGISLPEALGGSLPIHLGSHPNYSTRIAVNLEQIETQLSANGPIDPNEALDKQWFVKHHAAIFS